MNLLMPVYSLPWIKEVMFLDLLEIASKFSQIIPYYLKNKALWTLFLIYKTVMARIISLIMLTWGIKISYLQELFEN